MGHRAFEVAQDLHADISLVFAALNKRPGQRLYPDTLLSADQIEVVRQALESPATPTDSAGTALFVKPDELEDWFIPICGRCGEEVFLLNHVVQLHYKAKGNKCQATALIAVIPLSQELELARHVCTRCGAVTRSNARTGQIEAHNHPASAQRCDWSHSYTTPRRISVVINFVSPSEAPMAPLKLPPPPTPDQIVRNPNGYADNTSSSVKFVSGGLPGSARRR